MRLEFAEACLADPNEPTRWASVALLAEEESPAADFLLLNTVTDSSEAVWQKACAVLVHRHPWLILEPASPRGVPAFALATPLGRAWASLRLGIQRVVRDIKRGVVFPERLLALPAVIPDWIEELLQADRAGTAEDVVKLTGLGNCGATQRRQILLAPTYRCNLTCSYCYATGFSNGMPSNMSLGDLAFALDWAAAQGVDSVLVAGGEPTVYSYFAQLLELAAERHMSVRLTSNGLYPSTVRQRIAAPAIRELVAHYDQERLGTDDAAAELFEQNLRAAQDRGVEPILRYTLTELSGPAEWRAVMGLAQRLNLQQLNYALAFQGSAGLNTCFNVRDGIGRDGRRMEKMLVDMCDDAAQPGLRLHLSKPFPLCALSTSALRRLLYGGGMRSACAVHRDNFTRNLTINPDLSTFPCNGIAIRGPKISELRCLEEIGRHYAAEIERLMLRPYAEECRECALWYRGICRGSCLAEHYGMSRREEEREEARN